MIFAVGSIFTYFSLSFDTLKNPEQHEEDNVSVSKSDSTNSENFTDPVSQEKVTLITEPGFDAWIRKVSKIQLPDYQLDPELSNLGNSVTVIDKKLSFNKREFLTSDGELSSGSDKATEKTLTYVNGTKYFTISFMRNEENITNDFQGSDWLYFSQDNVYCVPFVMTYKNMIVLTTLQDTASPVDYGEAIDLSILIVEKLEQIEQF